MTFYLKYRPQTIEELDSEGARESLKKIISSGKVPHAMLFYGPKGTGKTSAARIVAKALNCEAVLKNKTKLMEPCNKCEQCLSITKGSNIDVLEMDAASHRGIDDARFLRDAVKLAPAKANKKVYIIDEVHMLTTEASNALLKTIEEPPDHVVFILATTNPEKLITTIRSRTAEIPFKKATVEEVVRSLSKVVKGEGLKLDKKSLSLIGKVANGSFRDSTKILEQIVVEKIPQKFEKIQEYLSQKSFDKAETFLIHLNELDIEAAIADIENVVAEGVSISDFISEVLDLLRTELLATVGLEKREIMQDSSQDKIVELVELLIKAKESLVSTSIEQLPLEVAIIKWCSFTKKTPEAGEEREGVGEKSKNKNTSSKLISSEEISEKEDSDKKKVEEEKKTEESTKVIEDDLANGESVLFSDENWQKILSLVKPVNTSVEALLRAARPVNFDGRTLKLAVFYRFHKERLEEEKYRKILEDVVSQVLHANNTRVVCTLAQPPKKEAVSKPDLVLTEEAGEDIIEVAKKIFS